MLFRLKKKSFPKLWVVVFSFALCNSASADWEIIGNTKDNSSTAYVDFSKIRTNGVFKDAWVLTDFRSQQKTSNGKRFLSVKAKMSFNCAQETRRSLSSVIYSGKMGNGEVVSVDNYDLAQWNHIVPGTLGEAIAQAVCQYYQ